MRVTVEEFIKRVRAYEANPETGTAILDCLEEGESVVFEGKSYCSAGYEGSLQIDKATRRRSSRSQ